MEESWYADATTVIPSNGEQFAAVEFLAENGNIAEVPVLWLRSKRIGKVDGKKAVLGKSYWPPKPMQSKAKKLAEKMVQPDKATWNLFDIAILKYGGTYADVVEATKAISGRESEADFSDSSVEEPLAARQERAKKHRKRRESVSLSGSDSGCDEELDTSHLQLNAHDSSSKEGASESGSVTTEQTPQKTQTKSLTGTTPKKTTPRKSPTKSLTRTTPRKTTPQKSPTKSLTGTTPRKTTPQKQGESLKEADSNTTHAKDEAGPFARATKRTLPMPFTLPPKTTKQPAETHSRNEFGPSATATKRTLPMLSSWSPSKRLSSFGPSKPSSPLMLSNEAIKKQSRMTNFVSSISERETSILEDELDSMEMSQGLFESPSSIRSASPAASEASDGPFKTPLERKAYRSLNYSSPSDSSGIRHVLRVVGEVQEKLMKVEKVVAKILSCVQPAIETNIAEDIPQLPLTDKEGEAKMNDVLKAQDQLNKVVTFLHGMGGASPREAVYNVMKTIFTDVFASTKSMKGIKRSNNPSKDAFMGTPLFKAVMCAVRRRFRDTSVSEVIELTGNWLKDAPSREKKRQRRKEAREELLREYDDTDNST